MFLFPGLILWALVCIQEGTVIESILVLGEIKTTVMIVQVDITTGLCPVMNLGFVWLPFYLTRVLIHHRYASVERGAHDRRFQEHRFPLNLESW